MVGHATGWAQGSRLARLAQPASWKAPCARLPEEVLLALGVLLSGLTGYSFAGCQHVS